MTILSNRKNDRETLSRKCAPRCRIRAKPIRLLLLSYVLKIIKVVFYCTNGTRVALNLQNSTSVYRLKLTGYVKRKYFWDWRETRTTAVYFIRCDFRFCRLFRRYWQNPHKGSFFSFGTLKSIKRKNRRANPVPTDAISVRHKFNVYYFIIFSQITVRKIRPIGVVFRLSVSPRFPPKGRHR